MKFHVTSIPSRDSSRSVVFDDGVDRIPSSCDPDYPDDDSDLIDEWDRMETHAMAVHLAQEHVKKNPRQPEAPLIERFLHHVKENKIKTNDWRKKIDGKIIVESVFKEREKVTTRHNLRSNKKAREWALKETAPQLPPLLPTSQLEPTALLPSLLPEKTPKASKITSTTDETVFDFSRVVITVCETPQKLPPLLPMDVMGVAPSDVIGCAVERKHSEDSAVAVGVRVPYELPRYELTFGGRVFKVKFDCFGKWVFGEMPSPCPQGEKNETKSVSVATGRHVGTGTYGRVYRCKIKTDPTNEMLAVKIFPKCEMAEEKVEEKRHARKIYIYSEGFKRELQIMKILGKQGHGSKSLCLGYGWFDTLLFTGILMPLAISDLCKLVKEGIWNFTVHESVGVGKWIYNPKIVAEQLVGAVSELKRIGIHHNDIKPANILVFQDRLVLTDYSLSLATKTLEVTTDYGATTIAKFKPYTDPWMDPCTGSSPFRPPENNVFYAYHSKAPHSKAPLGSHLCEEYAHGKDLDNVVYRDRSISAHMLTKKGVQILQTSAVDIWCVGAVLFNYLNPQYPRAVGCWHCALQTSLALSPERLDRGTGFDMGNLLCHFNFDGMRRMLNISALDKQTIAMLAYRHVFHCENSLQDSELRIVKMCDPNELRNVLMDICPIIERMLHHEPSSRDGPEVSLKKLKKVFNMNPLTDSSSQSV